MAAGPSRVDDYDPEQRALLKMAQEAFQGNWRAGIKQGFRLFDEKTGKHQLCSMYWSPVASGHQLELSVAVKKELGRFQDQVREWVRREIDMTNRVGLKHLGELSWPCVGFSTTKQAFEFLERVRQGREGLASTDFLFPSRWGKPKPVAPSPTPAAQAAPAQSAAAFKAQGLLAAFLARTQGLPDKTVAQRKTKQRIGQSLLRKAVLERCSGRCAVTALAVSRLLRVSHIKPWAQASDAERLDVDNCLLLAAHVDAAFDIGLVSFDAAGKLLASPRLDDSAVKALGLADGPRLASSPSEAQQKYLAWHLKHWFKVDRTALEPRANA